MTRVEKTDGATDHFRWHQTDTDGASTTRINVDVTFIIDGARLSQTSVTAFWSWASRFRYKSIMHRGVKTAAYQVQATLEPTSFAPSVDAVSAMCWMTEMISDTLVVSLETTKPTFTSMHALFVQTD